MEVERQFHEPHLSGTKAAYLISVGYSLHAIMMQTPGAPSNADDKPAATATAPAPVIDGNLGASVQQDSAAIQEDLNKVTEVVQHLPGSSVAQERMITHLKRLLQESSARFGHLQESIALLRQERHRLANEAMRAQGLEMMLKRITSERDQIRTERDGLLQAIADEKSNKHALKFDSRDVQVVELTVQVVNLKRELSETQRQLLELQAKWNSDALAPKPKTSAIEGGRMERE